MTLKEMKLEVRDKMEERNVVEYEAVYMATIIPNEETAKKVLKYLEMEPMATHPRKIVTAISNIIHENNTLV